MKYLPQPDLTSYLGSLLQFLFFFFQYQFIIYQSQTITIPRTICKKTVSKRDNWAYSFGSIYFFVTNLLLPTRLFFCVYFMASVISWPVFPKSYSFFLIFYILNHDTLPVGFRWYDMLWSTTKYCPACQCYRKPFVKFQK